MEFIHKLWFLFRNLNSTEAWNSLIGYVGTGNIYFVLFAIIFAETGLVITPFLPGDSLLFALGAIGVREGISINLPLVTGLLIIAAILGDAVNYWIGYKVGPAIFKQESDPTPVAPGNSESQPAKPKRSLKSRLLNKKHLLKAQEFYDKYGGKTIILARFVPVVRTFAPFVAGIGKMNFFRFWLFNIIGAVAWVLSCVMAGVVFGRFEFVQKNFEVVIIAIVVISVLPMAFELWKAQKEAKAKAAGAAALNSTAPLSVVAEESTKG